MGQNANVPVVLDGDTLSINGKLVAKDIKLHNQQSKILVEFKPVGDNGDVLNPVAIIGMINQRGLTTTIIGEELNRKIGFSFQLTVIPGIQLKFRIVGKLGVKTVNKEVTNIMDALQVFVKLFKGLN